MTVPGYSVQDVQLVRSQTVGRLILYAIYCRRTHILIRPRAATVASPPLSVLDQNTLVKAMTHHRFIFCFASSPYADCCVSISLAPIVELDHSVVALGVYAPSRVALPSSDVPEPPFRLHATVQREHVVVQQLALVDLLAG